MNADFFRKGKPFSQYAEPEFEEAYRNVSLSPGDGEFFSSLKIKVLVISEKWCGDCRRELPLIAHIADRAGWDLRIFGRDENPDLMETYATDGKRVIPVFVFFDETFREIGRFIEKAPPGKTTPGVLREVLEIVRKNQLH